ncbi:MAG: hypothetical protein HDS43_06355 [Bacteroides sp.]|nr:hypothetical protein [Bacteroides sp.]
MKRHFNTHLEGLDLQFWHDLIGSRGELVSLKKGEYLCRKGEPTNVCGYVKSGYFKYTVDGTKKIGGFAFPKHWWVIIHTAWIMLLRCSISLQGKILKRG